MRVSFFGQIATPFGGDVRVDIPEGGMTVTELRQELSRRFETDAILERSIRAAVNDEIVLDSQSIFPADTVDFMSPVSGG